MVEAGSVSKGIIIEVGKDIQVGPIGAVSGANTTPTCSRGSARLGCWRVSNASPLAAMPCGERRAHLSCGAKHLRAQRYRP